jgi:DNA-binding NarL/FixJ family response regulator
LFQEAASIEPRTAAAEMNGGSGKVLVLLVDDDSMVRSWVRLALRGTEFRVAGEAASPQEAVGLIERKAPDLVLVDYQLRDGVGTELVRDMRTRGLSFPAVVMTANARHGFNEDARDAGAQGTVLKTGKVDELLEALRTVRAGEPSFDPRHPKRPPGRAALSPREREILAMVAGGSTNREIAATLGVGDETVKTILGRVFAKLGARRRAEAVSEAHRLGLI